MSKEKENIGEGIIILGKTGSGKTYSLKGIKNKEKTFIIAPNNKKMMFKGARQGYVKGQNLSVQTNIAGYVSDMSFVLKKVMADPGSIENLILEDIYYTFSDELLRRANETGFEKYSIVGEWGYKIGRLLGDLVAAGVKVVIFAHTKLDRNQDGEMEIGMKTSSKFLDEKVMLEGLVNIVIGTKIEFDEDGKPRHKFLTQKIYGHEYIKTPPEMFEEEEIDNNLQIVFDAIDKY